MPRTRMLHRQHLISLTVLLSGALPMLDLSAAGAVPDFAKGVDLSILSYAEDHGTRYAIAGKPADAIDIFKQSGCNCVRLRLFLNPSGKQGQVNSLPYTLALARRVKNAGLSLYLDFHYSDGWADPGHQIIPADWKELKQEQLVKKVHDYTADTVRTFIDQGTPPDLVSIGNEITNGMIWPAGGPLKSEQCWPQLIELLRAGISAVRETAPNDRIILHIDRGAQAGVSEWFFSHCAKANLDFDAIGLSFYPFWNGTLDGLKQNLAALSGKYHKDIYIAETAYQSSGKQGKLPYPCTPDGQKQFLEQLMKIIAQTPDHRGKGIFYWEPEWIPEKHGAAPQTLAMWANKTLFDSDGNGLPALSAFGFIPSP